MKRLLFVISGVLLLSGCPAPQTVMPTADFSLSPDFGYAPLTVQFTDNSVAGTSPITAHYWNFGDAMTSSEAAPSHTYVSAGKFSVTLRVVSASGEGITQKDRVIEVAAPPRGPKAHFTADPQNGSAPLVVYFSDNSDPGERAITTWRWSFGDGGHSTLPNPAHTYTAVGDYTVQLSVSNSAGEDTTTETNLITILE